ncbi:MAG: hypothetical protein LR008_02205 [Candidatus Pacebacteria bacterium]|nr:hypothetical protein [Candidatus Paceibacterota bacterium]
MQTLDWTDKLDQLIHDAIQAGEVKGVLSGIPDHYVESGLAHVFFL